MVVFEANYDKINLQNIVMTSFQWHHHHYVTNIASQKFFQFGLLSQNFWLRRWSWVNNMMVFKKAVLVLKKYSWSWSDQSWSWKNRWPWSCNLVVLLHHWA